jgi:threonine dehydratase
VVPIGGGGLISGIAVAARAIRPEVRIVGVEAALYPSCHNAVGGADAPIGGATLARASRSRMWAA